MPLLDWTALWFIPPMVTPQITHPPPNSAGKIEQTIPWNRPYEDLNQLLFELDHTGTPQNFSAEESVVGFLLAHPERA